MREASANFDLEHVRPFLERLKPFVESGFSDQEIIQIQQSLKLLDVDAEKDFEFLIKFKGQDSFLKIHIFMDDLESPDIAFYAVPELANKIDDELRKFYEEHGL